MNFKVGYLFNLIFLLPLIYILIKGLQYIFKKKEEKVDLDILIKQKEQLFLLTMGSDLGVKKCKTQEAYLNYDSKDHELILDIFKGLQWGEGKFQRDVLEKIKKDFGLTLDFYKVTSAIKFLINNELLIFKEELLNYQEIINLTKLTTIYQNLFGELNKKEIKTFRALAKQKEMSAKAFKKAFRFQINESSEISAKVFSERLIHLLKNDHDILGELFLYAKVINKLDLIPALKSEKDLKGAYTVFGLKGPTSKEEIKKRYKELAKSQHPDTIAFENIPSDLIKMANKNFNQINQAYKLLMEKVS